MVYRRKAIRTTTTITLVAVLVVIVVAIGATGVVLLSSGLRSKSTTTTGGGPSTFYSTVSPQGLQLQVKFNTTALRAGGALTAQVSLFNMLDKNLSLVPDNSDMKRFAKKLGWQSHGCGLVQDFLSFALFHGHYTSANLSTAVEPLRLDPAASANCKGAVGFPYFQKIMFEARSNLAAITANLYGESNPLDMQTWSVKMQLNATTGYCRSHSVTVTEAITKNGSETTSILEEPGSECSLGTSLYGYSPSSPADINNTCFECPIRFPIGPYTLVAVDPWNQTLYAYFQVSTS